MPRLRLMLMALGLLACAWCGPSLPRPVIAQVESNPAANTPSLGLNLADRELVKRLRNAEQLTERGDVAGAVAQLQLILNQSQDRFFRPADDSPGRFISLKQQAESMLNRMSADAKRAYEQQFGAEARRMFNEAAVQRNPKVAEEVMRRFMHTVAGADSIYWLGSYHMDRADYESALQCLMRLRRLDVAARFEPSLSLRTAFCLYRTGRIDKSLAVVQEMKGAGKAPIKVGGRVFPADQAEQQILAWLKSEAVASQALAVTEPTGWLLSRGNSERNRLLRSSPPLGKSVWHATTSHGQTSGESESTGAVVDVSKQLQALKLVQQEKGVTPLPSASPLLVNDVVVARYFDHLAGFDAKTGQELWRSAEDDRIFHLLYKNLGKKEEFQNAFSGRSRTPRELLTVMLRQRAWEDLTFGTLSSDGEFVFSIEDLGFVNDIMLISQTGARSPTHPLSTRDYNRLCAYEAKTGRLKWELGGPRGEIALPQPGTFFLGPPLPFDHQLLCLVESQGLTHLLVLESRTGKTLWTQILSQPIQDLYAQPARRRGGLTPALMGDLLVCPTGTGVAVTVDLAGRSLSWAYQYTPPSPNEGINPRMAPLQLAMRMAQQEMDPLRGAIVDEWQDGSPILAEGHVILTPRDSQDLHCLSLEDGKVLWKKPRQDGLYVAAVQNGLVIVVGRSSVEALRLNDGGPAWTQPVPVTAQAGKGIVTESQILLPLAANEVLSLDLKTGRMLARARIHDGVGLGNLIPGPGFMVSQSAESLAVFRTLDSVAAETAARLTRNPQDAEALALRGEFRLSQGELAGGQADLRQSLKLKPSAETQTILFENLLEGLQADFSGQRTLIPELEHLAQSGKQRAAFYRVWAEGLLAAGELSATFDVLLKLSDQSLGRPTLERLDGHRAMRRDQWLRTQLGQLIARFDEPTRNRVQQELQQRLARAVADKNDETLRKYIRNFGSHPLANDARQALADRLVARGYNLEAEQLLAILNRQSDPRVAGRALAVMIRELIKLDRATECTMLVDRLEKEFAETDCLDGKTGKRLAEEWKPLVRPRAEYSQDWPTGRVELVKANVDTRNPSWSFDVAVDGDPGPFFSNSHFKTTQDGNRVVGLDGWGEAQWVIPISELGQVDNVGTFRSQVRNHVVLLTIGRQVCAISTLPAGKGIRATVLWNAPLKESTASDQALFFQVLVNRPGMFRAPLNRFDFRQNTVGTVGAIEDDTIVIISGGQLILAELLTGEPLWKRSDIAVGSEIMGDSETIVVIPPEETSAELIRRSDGVSLGTVAVPPAHARVALNRMSILSYSRALARNSMTLQLDDIPTRKTVWTQSFDLQSQFTMVSETELAVLEPMGMLSLLQLTDGQVRWKQKITIAPNQRDLWVIPNGGRLLVINGEVPARNFNRQAVVIGNNQLVIDGQAECLDRASGQPYWSHRVDGYVLDYTQPDYLPFWLFTVRTMNIQMQRPEFQLMTIDKRSGQILLKSAETSAISGYRTSVAPEAKEVQLTLFSSPQSIRHTFKYTDQPVDTPANPPNP